MTPVTQQDRPLARPAATLVWLLALGVPAGMLALIVAGPTPELDAWAIPLYSGIVATWGLMGALLVTRRPDNRVGWVLLAVGLGIGLALLGQLWAFLSIAQSRAPCRGPGPERSWDCCSTRRSSSSCSCRCCSPMAG